MISESDCPKGLHNSQLALSFLVWFYTTDNVLKLDCSIFGSVYSYEVNIFFINNILGSTLFIVYLNEGGQTGICG